MRCTVEHEERTNPLTARALKIAMVRNFRVGLNIYSIALKAGIAIWKLVSRTMTGHFGRQQVHFSAQSLKNVIKVIIKML